MAVYRGVCKRLSLANLWLSNVLKHEQLMQPIFVYLTLWKRDKQHTSPTSAWFKETAPRFSKHSLICVLAEGVSACNPNRTLLFYNCLSSGGWVSFINFSCVYQWLIIIFDVAMLSTNSMPRTSTVSITASTATTVAAAAVSVLQENGGPSQSAGPNGSSNSQQIDKNEINDAVTKVLQGYDWTLVPIASK